MNIDIKKQKKSGMQFNHKYWMQRLYTIASSESAMQSSEVPVSALIVKNSEMIACATNKIEKYNNAISHAEILAIQEASKVLGDWRLNDCTLYVTLEPCSMCAGAILSSRISKVVFGAYDLNYGACGSRINLFKLLRKDDQIDVIGGILELECSALLKEFFLLKR